MSVYVDDMRTRYGRMVMCHMTADSTEELLGMADLIGVSRKWIQRAGTEWEHFDICLAKRARAVAAGAIETTAYAQALSRIAARRAADPQRAGLDVGREVIPGHAKERAEIERCFALEQKAANEARDAVAALYKALRSAWPHIEIPVSAKRAAFFGKKTHDPGAPACLRCKLEQILAAAQPAKED